MMHAIDIGTAEIRNNSLVPLDAPLAMPRQSIASWRGGRPRMLSPWGAMLARIFVFAMTGLLAGYGTWQMYQVVGQSSATSLQILLVVLFALTFAWIALAAATTLLGFAVVVGSDRRQGERGEGERGLVPLSTRTAIVMPIYDEDTDAVFYALTRMAMELAATGQGSRFDIFVLSDSSNVETLRRERAAATQLRNMLG
ncbi:MAG TPA: glucan biosynthesis glucosyltransferase H, partial [Methyloceanibacter sp.]|nr:glucan biosynthesis glucosyltransferase H [Methyloceanibacter sp.]